MTHNALFEDVEEYTANENIKKKLIRVGITIIIQNCSGRNWEHCSYSEYRGYAVGYQIKFWLLLYTCIDGITDVYNMTYLYVRVFCL